jgi:hypothetical protein
LELFANEKPVTRVKQTHGNAKTARSRQALINKCNGHGSHNDHVGGQFDASMIEIGRFARCMKRAAREFTAVPLHESLPLNLGVSISESKKEVGVQVLYLAKGGACRGNIHQAAKNDEDRRNQGA